MHISHQYHHHPPPSSYSLSPPSIGLSRSGKSVRLNVWDATNAGRYATIEKTFYKKASAALICYDVTISDSYFDSDLFSRQLSRFARENIVITMVGTKIDMLTSGEATRGVEESVIRKECGERDRKVFEVSSKTGQNVAELFSAVAELCAKRNNGSSSEPPDSNTGKSKGMCVLL